MLNDCPFLFYHQIISVFATKDNFPRMLAVAYHKELIQYLSSIHCIFTCYLFLASLFCECYIIFLHLQEGLAPINLVIDDNTHRATPGGTGGVKTITNYAPVFFYFFLPYLV